MSIDVEQLKAGDVVTSGTVMVLDAIVDGTHARCVWHDDNDDPQEVILPLSKLLKLKG